MANPIPVTSDQWNKLYDQKQARSFQEYQFGEDIYRWEPDPDTGEFSLRYKRSAGDPDPSNLDKPSIPENLASNLDTPSPDGVKQPYQSGKAPWAAPVNIDTSGANANQPSNFSAYTGNNNMAPTNNPWGDWSPVFGEYSPQDQYRSMMATSMPDYYTPRYGQMANRQFAPTFGRYLLGGYGGDTTGLGTGSDFSQWYQGQGMTPGGTDWGAAASNNPGMAYAMQDPQAVQAMALARYYGGGAPQGYAARAVQSSLGNLYDRYATRGAQTGITGPSGFLNYLGGLNQSRFGAYPNA